MIQKYILGLTPWCHFLSQNRSRGWGGEYRHQGRGLDLGGGPRWLPRGSLHQDGNDLWAQLSRDSLISHGSILISSLLKTLKQMLVHLASAAASLEQGPGRLG